MSGFENLVHAYRPALLAYATRLTAGDHQRAEDAVQEVWLRAWRNLDRLTEDRGPVRAWLMRVTHNVVVDQYRKRQTRPAEVEMTESEAVSVPSPADAVVDAIVVRSVVDALPEAHRNTVVEIYFADRTATDAAKVLNIPVGTVKSRLHKALRVLRAELPEAAALESTSTGSPRQQALERRAAVHGPLPERPATAVIAPAGAGSRSKGAKPRPLPRLPERRETPSRPPLTDSNPRKYPTAPPPLDHENAPLLEEITVHHQPVRDVTHSHPAGLNRLPVFQRYKSHQKRWKRYEEQRPGHRVSIQLLNCVLSQLPFQVEKIQTGDGAEFQSKLHGLRSSLARRTRPCRVSGRMCARCPEPPGRMSTCNRHEDTPARYARRSSDSYRLLRSGRLGTSESRYQLGVTGRLPGERELHRRSRFRRGHSLRTVGVRTGPREARADADRR